ncbi:anti-sigma factor [Pseudaestuariivita sp.]|uniref:anti-sigma factor n=1 Tax=Pseudaestuariivita sp. TaxID=2211669 RepID=UPI004058827E
MSDQDDHETDAALAGEYVLSLMPDAERTAFEARLRSEPALRDLVRDWTDALVVMADEVPPETPPRQLKAKVDAALFGTPAKARRPLWQWLAGGTVAAAIALGAMVFAPPILQGPPATPTLTAQIMAEDGTLAIAASYFADQRALEIIRAAGDAPPGRVLELWLIAEGAAAPVSLGVLSADSATRLEVSDRLAAQLAGGVLAVSDEPPGGSPTGAPTGSVLAVGEVTDA